MDRENQQDQSATFAALLHAAIAETEGIDLSKVVLTHHTIRYSGKQPMPLYARETPPLPPITEAGTGVVQEKERALLREVIAKVPELPGIIASAPTQEIQHRLRGGCSFGVPLNDGMPAAAVGTPHRRTDCERCSRVHVCNVARRDDGSGHDGRCDGSCVAG